MRKSLVNSLVVVSMALGSMAASAEVKVWEGPGRLYNEHAVQVSTYRLKVEVETLADGTKTQNVNVYLPDGKTYAEKCTITPDKQGKSWEKSCENGSKGSGTCLSFGLCTDYSVKPDGTAYSTQIIIDRDGDNEDGSMRLLRYELVDGKPVHFFAESLHRVVK